MIPHKGELFAFVTAIVWAYAVILFKKGGETLHPIAQNILKNFFAMILFIPTIYLCGGSLFRQVPIHDLIIILISGIAGIAISDTLFFASLNRLGAQMTAIVDCLYGPFIIVLSILFLGETLSLLQTVGAFLIVFGVLLLLNPKSGSHCSRKDLLLGILLGSLAMLFTAVGVIMVKPVLSTQPLLWVTEIRLVCGTIFLIPAFFLVPQKKRIITDLVTVQNWKYAFAGSFTGTYIAMLLWLAGMKYTQASIAAALNQTSTLFIFVFSACILGEKVNFQKIVSLLFGFGGALLVTFG